MILEDYIRKVTFDETKELVKLYKYGLFYFISEMKFVPIQQDFEISWDELVEAYLFNDTEQLHIYQGEDGAMEGIVFTENGGLDYVDRTYELARKADMGSKIVVREYLDADEDGQISVAYTRLCCVK